MPIKTDGMYHVAAIEKSEDVRLSEDYFIEAQKEQPPKVRIARPGRDFKVNPIEEVTVRGRGRGRFRPAGSGAALFGERRAGEDRPLLKSKGAKTAKARQ